MDWANYSTGTESTDENYELGIIERFIDDRLGGLELDEIIEILTEKYPENFL